MVDVVLNDLKEYFNYIKEMYLKSFDKVLSDDVKNKIKEIQAEDIQFDMEDDFDIKINGTIHYKLNIVSFIENNHLLEEDLKELNPSEQQRVHYLIENKNSPMTVVKDSLLENMFLLFMPNRDILACGMSTYLAKKYAAKCHFNYLNLYEKEARIIESLIQLLGEKTIFNGILNGNYKELQEKYDAYSIESDSWKQIYKLLEQEFQHYYKNKNKIYYIDSLYNYSNLNYDKILQKIEFVKTCQDKIKNTFLTRVNSMVDCIQELNRYMILLREPDKNNIYYSGLNLKRILEKNGDLIQYREEILRIEKELKPIVNYIWNYYINFEGEYDPSSNYWFLIQNYSQITDDDLQIMNLITNEHIRVSNYQNRYKYGFIYRIKTGAIVYSAPERIIYKKTLDNTNNHEVEIEDQTYSYLLTPRNLLLQTLQMKEEYNSVLVNQKQVTKRAVYCICKSERDTDYEKALELANKYELPLIPLYESETLSR